MKTCLWYRICELKTKVECDSRGNIREYDATTSDNPIEFEGIKRRCEYYEQARTYRLRNRSKR